MKWSFGSSGAFARVAFRGRVGDETDRELRPDMGRQRPAPSLVHASVARLIARRGVPGRRADKPANGRTYMLGVRRRVVVKAEYRINAAVAGGRGVRTLKGHLEYLGRDEAQVAPGERDRRRGDTRERGESAVGAPVAPVAETTQDYSADAAVGPPFFDAERDGIDVAGVPARWGRDRHHWRVVVSPEDADQLDLRRLVRDYATRLERRLDTTLEWFAALHVNTDHPHAHLVIRGRRDDGRDLVLPPEFVKSGLRAEAEGAVEAQAGRRTRREADRYLDALAVLPTVTPIDGVLREQSVRLSVEATPADGWLGVVIPRPWRPTLVGHKHLVARLQTLEALGLARRIERDGPDADWQVRRDFVPRLRKLARAAGRAAADSERGQDGASVALDSTSAMQSPPSAASPVRRAKPTQQPDRRTAAAVRGRSAESDYDLGL